MVLAPMAGITNAAYRQLCREQFQSGEGSRGLFVCEMITSRGLAERDPKTLSMLQFDPGERLRSVQLYGVDPAVMAQATEILITEYAVGHVDLNFGWTPAASPSRPGVRRLRCTGVRRSRRIRDRPTGLPSRRSRPTSPSRCWVTGTFGRPPTRCGW